MSCSVRIPALSPRLFPLPPHADVLIRSRVERSHRNVPLQLLRDQRQIQPRLPLYVIYPPIHVYVRSLHSEIRPPSCVLCNSSPGYFGTDGNPPSNQFDFVTVFMHELTHGLGFTSLLLPVPSGTNPTGIKNFNVPGYAMMAFDVRFCVACCVCCCGVVWCVLYASVWCGGAVCCGVVCVCVVLVCLARSGRPMAR